MELLKGLTQMPHPTQAKARKIKKHGTIRGKKLTKKQEGFFGLIAGGGTPTRTKTHNEHLAERMTS